MLLHVAVRTSPHQTIKSYSLRGSLSKDIIGSFIYLINEAEKMDEINIHPRNDIDEMSSIAASSPSLSKNDDFVGVTIPQDLWHSLGTVV